MFELGMDVDALVAVAKQVSAYSDQLQHTLGRMDSLVRSLPGVWSGSDAQRFAGQVWPPLRRQYVAAQQEIAALVTRLNQEISQQQQASTVSPGGPLGTVLPLGMDWATFLDRLKATGENTFTAEAIGAELLDLSRGGHGLAEHLSGFTKALGGAGLALNGVDLVQDVANGDLLKGLLDAAPTGVSMADLSLGAASTLGPLALGVGAFVGFVEMTTPVTTQQQDDTYAQGVQEMFGSGADPNHLTPDQAQAMSQRYSGPVGVAYMISDTMDATANKIFPWNWGKK